MEIRVNGNGVSLSSSTLMDLVRNHDLDPRAVIVELNFNIIDQDAWTTTQINHGDTIELLSFVGGG